MKIGIDFHGVIDKAPEFFNKLVCCLLMSNHEVHIITGETYETASKILNAYGIGWTHFYSITDDLLNQGKRYKKDKNDRPCFSTIQWNRAKAIYCKEHGIDIMLDDSMIYGKYFTTPYFKMECIFKGLSSIPILSIQEK